ncbi:MAG: hypothetical protein LH480_07695 [Rubrivivax sp.]|nr:hypothetical protein [Rubrivivax sp.]
MTSHRLPLRARHTAAPALALLVSLCVLQPAQAPTVTVNDDTTGAPTFQRPLEDLSALSSIGTAAHYTAYAFAAVASGVYSFATSGSFDTFVLLYDTAFMPTAALLDALIASDDLGASFSTSGFAFGLLAGRRYT